GAGKGDKLAEEEESIVAIAERRERLKLTRLRNLDRPFVLLPLRHRSRHALLQTRNRRRRSRLRSAPPARRVECDGLFLLSTLYSLLTPLYSSVDRQPGVESK